MAKINRSKDPVSGAFTALTKPITPDELAGISKPVITSGLGSATSNINLDEFEGVKNNFLSGDDAKDLKGLEQTRYENQSGLGLVAKGIGNIGSTLLSEVAKMPGYLGGFTADVFSGNAFEGDFSNTVDNFWLNGVAYAKENTTDEWLKTYSNPNLTDAPLLEQLGDPTFWAKEGADGVGFLLSFLVPGQLLRALGVGAKGAGLLAKTGVAMNFEKAAGLIDSTSAVFLNTVLESAAEGSNAYDTAIKQGKTSEEAGQIGSNIFKKNIPVLLASNFFVEKYIMSGFNRLAGKQGLSRVTGDILDGSKELAALTTKQKLGRLATKAPAATLQEGLFEEGLQTTIEQKQGGDWSSIFEKYFDNLANMWNGESKDATDFGKAVTLGSLLGSVSGGVSTMFEAKAEDRLLLGQDEKKANTFTKWLGVKDREQKEGLVSVFRNAHAETGITNEELFNFDETGAITGFKPDIDKKLQTKLGVTALTNFYSDLVRQYDGNVEVAKREFINKLGEKGASLLDMLRINNDLSNYETIEQVNNRNDFDYFSRFFNLEGGKDLLDQHIDAVATKVKERYKANTGQELKQDITSEIKKKADAYFEINNKATKLATKAKYSIDSKADPLFNEFISMYQRDLAVTLADIDNADTRIENINSRINDVESKAYKKGYTDLKREGSSNDKIEDFLFKPDVDELKRLKSDKKAYEDSLKQLDQHYEKLTKEPQKLYDESIAKAKSLEKKIEREENKEAAKVADIIDKANEYAGEPVEYMAADGTIYTIEDKGDSVLVTNEAGQSKSFASFIEAERALKGDVTPVKQKKQREAQVSSSQTIPATEPDETNYNPSDVDVSTDPFYNHAKSNHLAETTGISIAYRQDGSDQTFTTDEGNILPLPYPSNYQQNWFNYTDDTGIDKSQHKLLLVNPKYDNSSSIEVAIGEMNPINQLGTDVFAIVINSQTKEPVRYNGELLINGVRTKDTKVPLDNSTEPAINWYSLMNSYLGVNFKTSLNRDQMNSNKKATDFPKKNEIEKVLGKKINDITYVQVLTELKPYVRVWGNKFYDDTYLQPVIKNGSMEADISGFTNGFPIRILDSEGNVKMFSPTETFDLTNRPYELVLSTADGKLIVNGIEQAGFKPGITYLRLIDSNQIVPLQNQMLNKDEIDLVLQVLAKVADKPNLDITISDSGIPAQGLESMQINNINFGYGKGNTAIPLFTSAKNRFGLFSMLMNWGSKSDTLSKYEIKIDKGNVVFGDKSLPLTFIRDNINDQTALQDLILFLRNKRFHVNNTILRSQPKVYFHPTSFKDGKIVFTKYNSYNDYVLSRLNTDVAPKSYYKKYSLPQFAQRNIIFNKPSSVENKVKADVSNQPSQVQLDASDIKDKLAEELNKIEKLKIGDTVIYTDDGKTPSSTRYEVLSVNGGEVKLKGVSYLPPGGIISKSMLEYFAEEFYNNAKFYSRIDGDIAYVFSQSPELNKIGSQQDYKNYIASIFPNSVMKNVVYHGSYTKIDKFDNLYKGKTTNAVSAKKGFHFTNSFNTADSYQAYSQEVENLTKEEIANKQFLEKIQFERDWTEEESVLYQSYLDKSNAGSDGNTINLVLLDIKKLYSFNAEGKNILELRAEKNSITELIDRAISEKADGLEILNIKDSPFASYGDNNYVVFKPEQIHVLGSSSDAIAFKKYIESLSLSKPEVKVRKSFRDALPKEEDDDFGMTPKVSVKEEIKSDNTLSTTDTLNKMIDSGKIKKNCK